MSAETLNSGLLWLTSERTDTQTHTRVTEFTARPYQNLNLRSRGARRPTEGIKGSRPNADNTQTRKRIAVTAAPAKVALTESQAGMLRLVNAQNRLTGEMLSVMETHAVCACTRACVYSIFVTYSLHCHLSSIIKYSPVVRT